MKISIITLIIFMLLNCNVCAESFVFEQGQTDDLLGESAQTFELDELIYQTPDDVKDLLSQFDIDFSNPQGFLDVFSLDGIKLLFENSLSRISLPKTLVVTLLVVIIVSALSTSLSDDKLKSNYSLQLLCSLFCSAIIIYPTLSLMRNSVEIINILNSFMLIFIPIFAGILIAALKSSVAVSYSTTMFFVCETLSYISGSFVLPLLNCFLALSVATNINSDENLSSVANVFKRVIYLVISVALSLFLIVLSLQTVVTSLLDNTITKTTKVFVSYIPIIGPALSESLGSLRGCIDLLKSTAGIYAIIVVVIAVLPTIIEVLVYKLAFFLCSQVSSLYNITPVSKLLNSVGSVLTIMLSLLACVVVMFVFSITIIFVFGKAI